MLVKISMFMILDFKESGVNYKAPSHKQVCKFFPKCNIQCFLYMVIMFSFAVYLYKTFFKHVLFFKILFI